MSGEHGAEALDTSGLSELALLVSPSANRVYSGTALAMLRAELAVFDDRLLTGGLGEPRVQAVGGATYLRVPCAGLTADDLARLANLSSLYALFGCEGDLLRPLPVARADRFDDDLLTILKYRGKTNEQFTRLLLNVTAAHGDRPERAFSGGLRVLDPLCGRGTTLSQALMYGHDAYGLDVDKTDVETYAAFVQRWLRTKRLKHAATDARLRRDRRTLGRRVSVELAATKEDFRAGRRQTVDVVHADTLAAGEVYAAGSFDLVVTDAPYGVQHRADRGAAPARRDPTALLAEAVPVWAGLLRPGGAMGISWNTQLTSRGELAAALAAAGLEVAEGPGLDRFEHRVDQAIDRDLVIARKPAAS